MKIAHLFAVPIVEFRLDDHEALNGELTALFLEREAEGDAYRNEIRRATQGAAVFESRFDLFRWPDAPVRRLTAFCHQNVAATVQALSDYSDDELGKLVFDYHAWFHVTRTGGYQGLHNHQNASWSAIYCVDPGDSPVDQPDSGVVRFHDPRGCADYYLDAGNRRLKMPSTLGAYQVRHEAGKMVVFPSYLYHEIFPYRGERPRIVVALNCWIRQGK